MSRSETHRRLTAQVRQALRDHHGGFEPDPGFAARVIAGLERSPSVALGWAALRLLPATLALAALLTWWVAAKTPGPAALLLDSPAENPLGWVAEAIEDRP